MKGRSFVTLLVLQAACSPAPIPWHGASADDWPMFRQKLVSLREARPRVAWTAGLRATMRQARSGHVVDARGGIAIAPGKALRMILLAGAGTTLLDAWVTRDRWRIAIPPIGLVRRGGHDEPSDLPVGFLRWWFFAPLEGRLFAATRTRDAEQLLLLRDGDAVVELQTGQCLGVSRRVERRTERVEECPPMAVPREGDRVRYEDTSTGLAVDLVLETIGEQPPGDEPFRDPDGPSGGGA